MDWLKALGLNEKQQACYMYLLENGSKAASELAAALGEQRTNIYLITEELIKKQLISRDDKQSVARFKALHPERLQALLETRQKSLQASEQQLKKALPDLAGLFHLTGEGSGFAYFEGLKGYKAALLEMNKAKEVCVFGAAEIETRPDAWDVLKLVFERRAALKIPTRLLFDLSVRQYIAVEEFNRKLAEVKFWGNNRFDGEIAIYDYSVALTNYDEQLPTVVIKNSAIAATFQAIFDTAWGEAVS